MKDVEPFWKLDALSDQQVLDGLRAVLASGRRLSAQLVAHLAEVEERRLHLQAASTSLFHYCVARLGLSEDEACRRIEVARLARRHPAIFPLLASGELTLSVVALLKPHLCLGNHQELLAAVRGRSVQQAREVLATLFPKPDVPSVVRKLPERSAATPPLPNTTAARTMPRAAPFTAPPPASPVAETAAPNAPAASRGFTLAATPSTRESARVEPLSAARYKVQFTASAELKAKLELARDLMRHAHPSGDFAPIIERALELLIESLMKRRFGSTARPSAPSDARENTREPADTLGTRQIRRAARRTVLERDGLGCSWVDADGVRCNARAWLEHDHRHPQAKGGNSEPANLRLLCRAHNRFAAEQAYGREHIERAAMRHQRPDGSSPSRASCSASTPE